MLVPAAVHALTPINGHYVSQMGSVNKANNIFHALATTAPGSAVWLGGKFNPALTASDTHANSKIIIARLDMVAKINDWSFGQLSWNASANKVVTSFIGLGNLNTSPWYVVAGKSFLDFGDFHKYDDPIYPLTKTVFRVNGTNLDLGFDQGPVNASLYTYSAVTGQAAGGVQWRYRFTQHRWHALLAAAYLTDIRNLTAPLKHLDVYHTVPASDLYLTVKHGPWQGYAEWVQTYATAQTHARLAGWDVSGDYRFHYAGKAWGLSLGYSQIVNGQQVFPSSENIPWQQWLLGETWYVQKGLEFGITENLNTTYQHRQTWQVLVSSTVFF